MPFNKQFLDLGFVLCSAAAVKASSILEPIWKQHTEHQGTTEQIPDTHTSLMHCRNALLPSLKGYSRTAIGTEKGNKDGQPCKTASI